MFYYNKKKLFIFIFCIFGVVQIYCVSKFMIVDVVWYKLKCEVILYYKIGILGFDDVESQIYRVQDDFLVICVMYRCLECGIDLNKFI